MRNLLMSLLAATPVPSETADPANTWYSPGTIGFVMTFIVVVAALALMFDMVRRVRRVRYRAEIQAKLDAEAGGSSSASQGTKPAAAKPAAAKPASAKPTAQKSATTKPAAAKPKASTTRPKPDRPAAPPKPKRD